IIVVVRTRKGLVFLNAPAESEAGDAAVAKASIRLEEMKSCAVRIGPRVEETAQPLADMGKIQGQKAHAQHDDGADEREMFQVGPAADNDAKSDTDQNGGGAEVRLQGDEKGKEGGDDNRR